MTEPTAAPSPAPDPADPADPAAPGYVEPTLGSEADWPAREALLDPAAPADPPSPEGVREDLTAPAAPGPVGHNLDADDPLDDLDDQDDQDDDPGEVELDLDDDGSDTEDGAP